MSSLTLDSLLGQKLQTSKLIAVLTIDREADAEPLAEALLNGGIDIMELTLRTPSALAALKSIRQQLPEMTVATGTVLTTQQVDQVLAAGAHFAVSPAMNPQIITYAKQQGLPFAPGVMTPTDIDTAVLNHQCDFLKFFPATSSGGLNHLQNIAAPYAHLDIKFIPLGGVTANNMLTWLDCEHVGAIGGSWLAPKHLIASQDWASITQLAKQAREKIDNQ